MKTSESSLLERYQNKIAGVLGCYDRIVMTGTLLEVSFPAAVQSLLDERGLRYFEIGEFAEPLRETVRENAQAVAEAAGLEIEYLDRKGARKVDRVAAILQQRGDQHRDWFTFSLRWRTAAASNPGGTRRVVTRSCG